MPTLREKHHADISDEVSAPMAALLKEIVERPTRIDDFPSNSPEEKSMVVSSGGSTEIQSKPSASEDDGHGDTRPAESCVDEHYISRNSPKMIVYPGRHPLDTKTQKIYDNQLNGLLARLEIINRLTYLPPDDGREKLTCTEEIFLTWARYFFDRNTEPLSIPQAEQICVILTVLRLIETLYVEAMPTRLCFGFEIMMIEVALSSGIVSAPYKFGNKPTKMVCILKLKAGRILIVRSANGVSLPVAKALLPHGLPPGIDSCK